MAGENSAILELLSRRLALDCLSIGVAALYFETTWGMRKNLYRLLGNTMQVEVWHIAARLPSLPHVDERSCEAKKQ